MAQSTITIAAAKEQTAQSSSFSIGEAEKNILKSAFAALNDRDTVKAEEGITVSIANFEKAKSPPDEVAALYQTRGGLRLEAPQTRGGTNSKSAMELALQDFTEAIRLLKLDEKAENGPLADPSSLPRAYLGRAEVNRNLEKWKEVDSDLTLAEAQLDRLPRIAQTNPYLYQARARARARLGNWRGAGEDALEAEEEFKLVGDKLRSTLAAADAALFLSASEGGESGGGAAAAAAAPTAAAVAADSAVEAAEKMTQVFREKGKVFTNSPDDLPLLQDISLADAELHLAYAALLYDESGVAAAAPSAPKLTVEEALSAQKRREKALPAQAAQLAPGGGGGGGSPQAKLAPKAATTVSSFDPKVSAASEAVRAARASTQWESGCIRVETFVRDANERRWDELRQPGLAEELNPSKLAKKAVGLAAGLPADSPYITEKPGEAYYFYRVGGLGGAVRREPKVELKVVESRGLSCADFADAEWLASNRPLWPPQLRAALATFVAEVDPVNSVPLVMPPKGSPPSLGERVFMDGDPSSSSSPSKKGGLIYQKK